jgi:hypothetical protein
MTIWSRTARFGTSWTASAGRIAAPASATWTARTLVCRGLAQDCKRFRGGQYRAAERQTAADGATIRASYPLAGYCALR